MSLPSSFPQTHVRLARGHAFCACQHMRHGVGPAMMQSQLAHVTAEFSFRASATNTQGEGPQSAPYLFTTPK